MVYLGNESHCTETIIEFHPEKLTFVYFHHISIYRVSKQVWNRQNVIFWSLHANRKITKKCILLQKIEFGSFFFVNCKIENWILSDFSPIILCSNLFSKLFAIGEKLLQNPFSFLQFTKKDWNSIFWSRIHFFGKRILFRSQTFWGYSKLVGTLCKSKFICWKYKLLNTENTLLFNVSYAALNQS